MVFSPEELEKLNEQDKKEISELEKQIDQTLADKYSHSKQVCFYINEKMKARKEVIDRIKEMYEKAGWIVIYEELRRVGDNQLCKELIFKPKKYTP